MDAPTTTASLATADPWWARRWLALAAIALLAVPFLYPAFPPMVDLPGHMARFRVALDLPRSPELQRYFGYHWQLISNLGVDLLVVPLGRLIGLEPAVKLVVMLLPVLTGLGFLKIARAKQTAVPLGFWFALPLCLSSPLLFGFVNFVLGAGLALLVFGWWLERRSPWLLALAGPALMIAHLYGWAMLGLMVAGAVLGEGLAQRRPAGRLVFDLVRAGWPLASALLLVPFLARSDGIAFDNWFNWHDKLAWTIGVFRDRWGLLDILASVAVLVTIILGWRRLPLKPALAGPAVLLILAGLLLPYKVMGSAFADMRLFPYAFAFFVLAIDFATIAPRTAIRLAAVALALVAVRVATVTASNIVGAREQAAMLGALDRLPLGTRLATVVGQACDDVWQQQRHAHLGSMITVRRMGFSNDQWPTSGINPLERRYHPPNFFDSDPSELVQGRACKLSWSIDDALANLPRGWFDYVMLIRTEPAAPGALAGLTPIWRNEQATLYRVERPNR